MIKDKKFVDKYFPYEYEIVDEPYFGYEVHIGKKSMGWKPLFQNHDNAYHSVEEMKEFVKTHSTKISIYNEYNEKFTLEELEERLIDGWRKEPIRYMKFISEGVLDEIFGGKKYLVESTIDDYDITIPYDHLEYEKFDQYNHYNNFPQQFYTKDKDGYDFHKGDFC